MHYYYEHHVYDNPNFPFIFHETALHQESHVMLHWHEAIELLYFEEGIGVVLCDSTEIQGYPGDLIVVNSHTAHRIHSASDTCRYKCIILDVEFTQSVGINVSKTIINSRIHDSNVGDFFDAIYKELQEENLCYQGEIRALAARLLIYLCRNYTTAVRKSSLENNGKIQIVKDTITYIREEYSKPLTVDEISERVGFSKYYLSRLFKEVSGSTMVEYINSLRCEHARKMIRSGRYNVSESAERSGYNNLSYFTRSYKKQYGILPSEEQSEPEVML